MFQKPTFGSNTSGFGSFSASTTASPFGFKPTASTSAFGATPAFGAGAGAQANTTSTGLFGSTNNASSTLFGAGNATTAAPAFGASGAGFGRGRGRGATTGGLFGASTGTSGGLFGTAQPAPAFGASPSTFGFGSTQPASGSGLFGASTTTGSGLFGQQNNSLTGGGLFSNTTGGFNQQQQQQTGTAVAKYNPQIGTDVLVKSGNSQTINIRHHCITCMKEYEGKSLEELRLEDYIAGRKGPAPGGGLFGGFNAQPETKPLFGASGFGQPATTSAPGVFGGGTMTTGSTFGQSNTFSFGGGASTSGGSTLFGANKPAFGATPATGTGLFGATSTQAPSFGTPTSSFAFGPAAQTQTGGLFGAKPATSGFGATPSTSAFGATTGAPAFGSTAFGGGLFGAKPSQSAAPAFGAATPAFGSMAGGFGTGTSAAGGTMFGSGTTFGKPATAQPAFGFGNTQQSGLGGVGTMGGGALQMKPTSGFGLGGGLFQQPQANNTFKTDGGGVGGSLFGNTSTFGGTGLGLGGLGTNAMQPANVNTPSSSSNNVHEQILTLAARPYRDSPLYKDLSPNTSTSNEEVVKPSNPAALKALAGSGPSYRMTSPIAPRLKLLPRSSMHQNKKSLFDSLDDSDGNIEEKLSLKPSRKRLVLRPNQENRPTDNSTESSRMGQHNEQTDRQSEERVSQTDGYVQAPNKDRDVVHEDSIDGPNWNRNEQLSINRGATPTLYPNLDEELIDAAAEERASWFTTRPLPSARKPISSKSHSQESSLRDLGVRSDSLEHDKENIDNLLVSEEELAPRTPAPPHPAGVKLTRPGYYTIPSLEEMTEYLREDGTCVVPHLTIGRYNYGNVFYDCPVDVAGLDLDALVHFHNKEVTVYPEDSVKPPVGQGLNRRAIVTLDRVWPRDKTQRRPITDPDRLHKMDYEGKLRRVCDKHDTRFIEYRPETGSWVFRVGHFSNYGLPDSRYDEHVCSDESLT